MKLEHGKSYIDGLGNVVTVHLRNLPIGEADSFPFKGDNGLTYMEDGVYLPHAVSSVTDLNLIGPAISLQ